MCDYDRRSSATSAAFVIYGGISSAWGETSQFIGEHIALSKLGIYRAIGTVHYNGSGVPAVEWPDGPPDNSSAPILDSGQLRALNCTSHFHGQGLCELDGKLSVLKIMNRTLIFARLNPLPHGGGRWIQVSSSPDGLGNWSTFQPVQFEGVVAPKKDTNVYFISVRPFRLDDGSEGILALMPANLRWDDGPALEWNQSTGGGVYASVCLGADAAVGVRWSRPVKVLDSPVGPSWRTTDHPVDGGGADHPVPVGSSVEDPVSAFSVDESVCEEDDLRSCAATDPLACRYEITPTFMNKLVGMARRG